MTKTSRAIWIGSVSVLAIVAALFAAMIALNVTSARRAGCKGDLAQIGHALKGYCANYGTVPPMLTDATGRPMHSWRVLIVPQFSDSDFVGEYDLSQPWDSPHNRRVATAPQHQDRGRLFGCGVTPHGNTRLVAVVGANSYWKRIPQLLGADAPDMPERIGVLVLEYVGQPPIHWTEPRDLTVAEAIAYVTTLRNENAFPTNGLLYYGTDGGTHYMPPDISDAGLRWLLVDGVKPE